MIMRKNCSLTTGKEAEAAALRLARPNQISRMLVVFCEPQGAHG